MPRGGLFRGKTWRTGGNGFLGRDFRYFGVTRRNNGLRICSGTCVQVAVASDHYRHGTGARCLSLPPSCVVFAKAYSPIPGKPLWQRKRWGASDRGPFRRPGELGFAWLVVGTRWLLVGKSGSRGLQHPGQPDVPTPGLSCQPPVKACVIGLLWRRGVKSAVVWGGDYAVLGAAPNAQEIPKPRSPWYL